MGKNLLGRDYGLFSGYCPNISIDKLRLTIKVSRRESLLNIQVTLQTQLWRDSNLLHHLLHGSSVPTLTY